MSDTPIYFMDFEGSAKSGIIEYGVVEMIGGAVGRVWTRLCAPAGEIDARESAMHGLYARDLGGVETVRADWDLFAGWRERGLFGAHSARVEEGLICGTWPCPRPSPDFRDGASGAVLTWGPWVDTLELYRTFYPGLPNYQLASLVGQFDLHAQLDALAVAHCPPTRAKYHCALYDALASALLWQRLASQEECAQLRLEGWLRRSAPSIQARQRGQQRTFEF